MHFKHGNSCADFVLTTFSLRCPFCSVIRLLRIFRMLPSFGLTLRSMVEIIPVLAQYITVLLAGMYFFAIVGEWSTGRGMRTSRFLAYMELWMDTLGVTAVTRRRHGSICGCAGHVQ